MNCNGHVAADQTPSQWRDEDQHNGNAQPSEGERNESPVYPVCNGSADVEEPHADTEESGASGSGGAGRFLEEGELEHSMNTEQGEDGYHCGYTSEDHLGNGQPTKGDAGNDAPENHCCNPVQ